MMPAIDRALASARPKITALLVDRLSKLASDKLGASAAIYTRALSDPRSVEVTATGVKLKLTDPVAAALESGFSAFDMKQKLLAHATKFSKKGTPYVDVPFQHKASSIPRGARDALGRAAKASATSESRTIGTTRGESSWRYMRGRLMPLKYVRNKVGIQDQMIRSSVRTGGRSSVRYTTIRRVSAASSGSSWWHPGFRGVRLFPEVSRSIKPDIVSILRDALRAAGLTTKGK